jgi:hypothetical protein
MMLTSALLDRTLNISYLTEFVSGWFAGKLNLGMLSADRTMCHTVIQLHKVYCS